MNITFKNFNPHLVTLASAVAGYKLKCDSSTLLAIPLSIAAVSFGLLETTNAITSSFYCGVGLYLNEQIYFRTQKVGSVPCHTAYGGLNMKKFFLISAVISSSLEVAKIAAGFTDNVDVGEIITNSLHTTVGFSLMNSQYAKNELQFTSDVIVGISGGIAMSIAGYAADYFFSDNTQA